MNPGIPRGSEEMTDWITENSALLSVFLDAMMAIIWLVYLQLLVMNLRRQRRADIHISLGGRGNWFVSNLGLEPIYISDILAETEIGGETRIFELTEKSDRADGPGPDPVATTNHGPLQSGGLMSICGRQDLLDRIERGGSIPNDVESVTISVLAETAATDKPVGASRRFRCVGGEDGPSFRPAKMRTRQIRSRLGIRRLTGIVKQRFRTV